MMPLGGLAVALLAGWKVWDKTREQINLVKPYSEAFNTFVHFTLRFLAPILVLVVIATGV